jgi:hypothetical protein|tara:strand:+ start:5876 stop:6262 length:387 start_codon:yes stop_codon:yes gene_type:complete
MRAHEFLSEAKGGSNATGKRGKLHPEQLSTMPKSHKFAGASDRIYDLNRAMMAVACSDGKTFSHPPSEESWIGRSNMANPYTEQEHNMLHHAYKAIGIEIDSAVSDHSCEPSSVHKVSPVTGFKGYPR